MDAPAAAPAPLPSLRNELLFTAAVLAAAALLIAVSSAGLFYVFLDEDRATASLVLLIVADVGVFVLFGAHQLRRLVLRPITDTVAAAEAIAAGDLARRVPHGATVEFAALSDSVNRMTDRLIAEQAKVARAEKLASVGRLAAGIAHEIGNPLGAVNGYAHILRSRLDGTAQAREALDGLERESGRIDRIIRGLLDYAKPRKVTPTPIDVNRCIRSVVDMLRLQGAFADAEVALDLDDAGPHVIAERHELEQVCVNLLLNAVDAMAGTGAITIVTRRQRLAELLVESQRRAVDSPDVRVPRAPSARVRAWLDATRAEEVVKVIVADAGPGVPPEHQERIFDPFFTTKEPGRGTGLGLAIVARIVDHLSGVVWVQRSREGGAAFVMLFPLAHAVPRASELPAA